LRRVGVRVDDDGATRGRRRIGREQSSESEDAEHAATLPQRPFV
jgi:hypothetical protein